MILIERYKGYEICRSSPTGGKAGKGYNKTSTVYARRLTMGSIDCKQFRFNVGVTASKPRYIDALEKAKKYIDEKVGSAV